MTGHYDHGAACRRLFDLHALAPPPSTGGPRSPRPVPTPPETGATPDRSTPPSSGPGHLAAAIIRGIAATVPAAVAGAGQVIPRLTGAHDQEAHDE